MLIVGPAGTGKTTALRPAVAQLRSQGRPVFGVAPSAAAAEVLQHETGVAADTLDKLLIEHRLVRPPDHQYDLPVGSTVIVDEAGMMSTPKLAELAGLADQKHWRLVLVGDPLQFSAVGRGGMFELFVDTNDAVELDRVHRFGNDWERDASLRLRRCDVEIAEVYDHQGRLHGGSVQRMRQQAIARWWTEREAGRTALLMSPTNETVVDLNLQCQLQRLRAGELDPDGPQHSPGGMSSSSVKRSRPGRTIGNYSPTEARWSATVPSGPCARSTEIYRSRSRARAARSDCRGSTSPNTSTSPTPEPEPAHKAERSTPASCSSTERPTSATSTSR